jgi:hypothetical protein
MEAIQPDDASLKPPPANLEAELPDFGPDWRAAQQAGIDMWLLLENLNLSPWERLQENQRALNLVRMLQEADAAANADD